ncbi:MULTISPECIES: cation diffusion facilitator family transporter [unclassified Massilia]|uniref:cation diffusion facilitator family transporter n=1 Tax=unclassified Massilia TaxID=2609279 RepID=UPI00177F7F08|nr:MULTISPECIES: cation diffusion facilitator family transporter [unclassified Massilia]MBD8531207.1 cation diffusion facilitator family transporter [Massilia sp. CFBP 13647]MBD8675043.1 cation diffusion facilitator family transporter [Massilia sp. CFBP 13721]
MTNNKNAATTSSATPDSRKVIYAAIVANLGIATAKFIVAALTGSAAMLAEGIHSAVDTGNELLLLVGEKISARKPDARHPFGYGKAVYFWALIVALSVFSLGGGLSIYHGIHSLQAPEALTDPFWNYVVLGVAFLFEGYSWNVSRRALNSNRRPGATLWQTVRASKDASVFTVFIEDSAALLGLLVAGAGIFLGHLLDNPYIDPAASIVIGLLLVGAAFTLARETGALLVGESVGIEQTGKLKEIFRADPAIETVGQLMTMQLGPDDVLLTAAVRFKRGMRIDEVDVAIARLERAVRDFDPAIGRVYFEAAALRSAMG